MRPIRRGTASSRYSLAPAQHAAVDRVAAGLPPTLKHSFLLRVSSSLHRSAAGPVTDELLRSAISAALDAVLQAEQMA